MCQVTRITEIVKATLTTLFSLTVISLKNFDGGAESLLDASPEEMVCEQVF